ncbi:MAG: hypothetical protein JWR10_4466 [Rubritepida sp.]|nr:hypothetical protein [Rubritepida sp.]
MMDDATLAALVQAAGLEETARRFPGDVREAVASLAKLRPNLRRSSDPALEPTPAYVAPKGTAQ